MLGVGIWLAADQNSFLTLIKFTQAENIQASSLCSTAPSLYRYQNVVLFCGEIIVTFCERPSIRLNWHLAWFVEQDEGQWGCQGRWPQFWITRALFNSIWLKQNLAQPVAITQAAYLLIAAGAFVFVVSFLGYCGAMKESRCLLTMVLSSFWYTSYIMATCFNVVLLTQYGAFVLIIVALEVTAGCLAATYQPEVIIKHISLLLPHYPAWIIISILLYRLSGKLNRTSSAIWKNITRCSRRRMHWPRRGTCCK